MNLSARQLGAKWGLSGEETNQFLLNKGVLSGTPGDYSLTEFGKNYGISQSHHRGPGGSPLYNRDWTTRVFKESILDDLGIDDESIKLVKSQVATRRAERYATQAAARARADREFLAKETAKKVAEFTEKQKIQETEKLIENLKKVGKAGVIIAGISLASYGVYKAVTYIITNSNEKDDETYEEDV